MSTLRDPHVVNINAESPQVVSRAIRLKSPDDLTRYHRGSSFDKSLSPWTAVTRRINISGQVLLHDWSTIPVRDIVFTFQRTYHEPSASSQSVHRPGANCSVWEARKLRCVSRKHDNDFPSKVCVLMRGIGSAVYCDDIGVSFVYSVENVSEIHPSIHPFVHRYIYSQLICNLICCTFEGQLRSSCSLLKCMPTYSQTV